MILKRISLSILISGCLAIPTTANAQKEDWSAYSKASEEVKKMGPLELDALATYLAECTNNSSLAIAVRSCQVARNKFKIQFGAMYPMVDAVIESAENERELRQIIGGGRVSSYTAEIDKMLSDGVQAAYKAQKR